MYNTVYIYTCMISICLTERCEQGINQILLDVSSRLEDFSVPRDPFRRPRPGRRRKLIEAEKSSEWLCRGNSWPYLGFNQQFESILFICKIIYYTYILL
jgi:hypothetical protein